MNDPGAPKKRVKGSQFGFTPITSPQKPKVIYRKNFRPMVMTFLFDYNY
jgi:hypothetical protein